MIVSMSLGGQSLISPTVSFLQAFNNASFPATIYTRSKRGGYQGNKLISPTFASYSFVLNFQIIGKSFADLGVQRDNFLGILGTIHSAGVQRLIVTRSDGSMRFFDVKAVQVTGDMKPDDGVSSIIAVTLEGEYPFLQSYFSRSQNLLLNNGGGMTVPMGVPLDLSHGGVPGVSISNNGNYPAFPAFTFTGVLTNPSLSITQNGITQTLSLAQTLVDSAHSIAVDCYNRTVILQPSGNVARQYMTGTFWTVPVGVSSVVLGSTNGGDTGNVLISWSDTWLNI